MCSSIPMRGPVSIRGNRINVERRASASTWSRPAAPRTATVPPRTVEAPPAATTSSRRPGMTSASANGVATTVIGIHWTCRQQATASSSWTSSRCRAATTRGPAGSARAPAPDGLARLARLRSDRASSRSWRAGLMNVNVGNFVTATATERLRRGQHVRVLRVHAGGRGHRQHVRGSVGHRQRVARPRLGDGNDHVRRSRCGNAGLRPRRGHDVRERVRAGSHPGLDVGE